MICKCGKGYAVVLDSDIAFGLRFGNEDGVGAAKSRTTGWKKMYLEAVLAPKLTVCL